MAAGAGLHRAGRIRRSRTGRTIRAGRAAPRDLRRRTAIPAGPRGVPWPLVAGLPSCGRGRRPARRRRRRVRARALPRRRRATRWRSGTSRPHRPVPGSATSAAPRAAWPTGPPPATRAGRSGADPPDRAGGRGRSSGSGRTRPSEIGRLRSSRAVRPPPPVRRPQPARRSAAPPRSETPRSATVGRGQSHRLRDRESARGRNPSRARYPLTIPESARTYRCRVRGTRASAIPARAGARIRGRTRFAPTGGRGPSHRARGRHSARDGGSRRGPGSRGAGRPRCAASVAGALSWQSSGHFPLPRAEAPLRCGWPRHSHAPRGDGRGGVRRVPRPPAPCAPTAGAPRRAPPRGLRPPALRPPAGDQG
ncbi:MAG: hypothetical protein BWX64_02466 [Acidobacteria bacterium ADurb.Bin051]|nr:MAG: hypothetical protein BWX64_02466 [Acidobacteria bacterium ADurb.Bin051]